jgi:type IV secretion system protein VirB1
MFDFLALAQQCAPMVAPQTLAAVVSVESSHNPFAIGVVDGRLARQPQTKAEALAAVEKLEAEGKNFSVGIAQVNRYNLKKYHLTYDTAFEPCANLKAGGEILADCYTRAFPKYPNEQSALQAALSCYYSGNFTRGFKPDAVGKPSYVETVLAHAEKQPVMLQVVPAIKTAVTTAEDTAPVLVKKEKEAAETPADAETKNTDDNDTTVIVESSTDADTEVSSTTALVF